MSHRARLYVHARPAVRGAYETRKSRREACAAATEPHTSAPGAGVAECRACSSGRSTLGRERRQANVLKGIR